jgi:hypothetical protein
MPVQQEADLKRTIEITALAVRELSCKDLGTYCKIYYGGIKRKSKKLRKDSGGEWKPKHPITLKTPGPSDLTIECWKKQRGKLLKKFLGRVAILSSQLDSVDQIKGWYELSGRGKTSEKISGKLYIRLTLPGKPKSLNQHVAEQRSRRVLEPSVPAQPGIVFDRTQELVGNRHQQQQVVTKQRPVKTVVQAVVQTDEYKLKMEKISALNCASEKELKTLQYKMKKYNSDGDNEKLKKEIEEILKGIKDSVQSGMKTLREVGESFNHNGSEEELRVQMRSSNYLLHQLTLIVDGLNLAEKQLKEQNIWYILTKCFAPSAASLPSSIHPQ